MKKKNIKKLTAADKLLATETAKNLRKANIFRSGMLVITDYRLFFKNADLKDGQPLHVREPRFLLVTSGEAEVEVNGIGMHLHRHSVMFVPRNGVVEIQSKSDAFNGCGAVFDHRTAERHYDRLFLPFEMAVSEQEAALLKQSIQLLHLLFSFLEEMPGLTEHLVSFLADYLSVLHHRFHAEHPQPTRAQYLFNEFITSVNQYVLKEKSIAYYAGMLGITSNYLSVLVKEQSRRSAKEWIELALVREAKLLLESDESLGKIASALGFCSATQFGTFFRKHAGLTPTAYRKAEAAEEP